MTPDICKHCGSILTDANWTKAKGNGWKVCNPCRTAYDKARNLKRTEYTYQRSRKSALKVLYGLTQSDYDAVYSKQHGCCAICGTHQSSLINALCVDHDHDTKTVRGLLCKRCNLLVGWYEKSKPHHQKIEDYLRRQND